MYYVGRSLKVFFPEDTISHSIKTRFKNEIQVKSHNYNKHLKIKFNKNIDVLEVAEKLKHIPGIEYADPNEIVREFSPPPDDTDYKNFQQRYMDSRLLNFEGVWDHIKGDKYGNDWIMIGFIDTDFTGCNVRNDLKNNLADTGPNIFIGNGSGHGTEVVSVACAETNNDYLIAGATWNCSFVPFIAQDKTDIRDALSLIKGYLTDFSWYNDLFVVNISMGYFTYDADLLCDELYNAGVLIVAAVANEGLSEPLTYPAAHSTVIGVGASNPDDDALSPSSNWGDDVELVAPGELIATLKSNEEGRDYEPGTSVAAPFVSSLIALHLVVDEVYEDWSNDEVRSYIRYTSKSIYDDTHERFYSRIDPYASLWPLTGIEDGVVGPTGPDIIEQNSIYDYSAYFYDEEPPRLLQ